jgi:hypothetical protein
MRRSLQALEIEYVAGSNTIWVHGPKGTTILRIKCSGKIVERLACDAPEGHADINVAGDINLCVPFTR